MFVAQCANAYVCACLHVCINVCVFVEIVASSLEHRNQLLPLRFRVSSSVVFRGAVLLSSHYFLKDSHPLKTSVLKPPFAVVWLAVSCARCLSVSFGEREAVSATTCCIVRAGRVSLRTESGKASDAVRCIRWTQERR